MVNSKRKGKGGELEVANLLKKHGFRCRRSVQYNGYDPEGQGDVVGLPGYHIEVKRVETGFAGIDKAMDQSIRDSKDGEVPTVFHRRNRKGWLVTMRFDDWIKYLEDGDE